MAVLTVAFLGDIVATCGRQAVQQQLPELIADHSPDAIVANAENIRAGSGISPELYRKLRALPIDGVTLGDHAYRFDKIVPVLDDPDEPIARPYNLPHGAPGKGVVRLTLPDSFNGAPLYIITLLGQVFMSYPCDNPFAAADRFLESIPERNAVVIVEAHMEATSEKAALAHHLDGRVAAVVGSHTHVPTADARVLPKGTALLTDLGMCGPYNSVIGRGADGVVRYMATGAFTRFAVGSGDERMCGAVMKLDTTTGRARSIEQVSYAADPQQPPFTA